MLEDRASRIALAASLLLHAALFAPVRAILPLPEGGPAAPAPRQEPMVFRFVDPPPVETEAPDEPSELLSSSDARAAQARAPEALPDGSAYATGPAPVPVTPRASDAGEASAGPAARESAAEETAERSEARPAPDRDSGPPQAAGATDPRLARPMATPRLRASAPEGGAGPPIPEVDQRLTRATVGEAFSLNTRAWRFGPYMERLKRAIEERIAPPAAFYYGTAAWITTVRFRIAPDGTLTELRLLDHRGVDNLQYVATDAIEAAADYEPLPTDFPEPYLEITANFFFNVIQEP